MKNQKLTVSDISQWLDNDEGLYNWFNDWRRNRYKDKSRRTFIRENRSQLEACINNVLTGAKPASYLAYE